MSRLPSMIDIPKPRDGTRYKTKITCKGCSDKFVKTHELQKYCRKCRNSINKTRGK